MPVLTPFADYADRYTAAGWPGVLPLPERAKKSPPQGYTGADGAYPGVAELDEWRTHRGTGNIGLRMGPLVIGIDVDDYGDKPGGATLAQLEAELGPLPATYVSTSRDDGVSGIRFYRLPEAVRLVGSLPGIEIIQRHHRYAVVAPSIHPEGRAYYWISPDGEIIDVPNVDDLPELPPAWIAHLRADAHTPRQRHTLATGTETAPAVERAFGAAMIGMTQGTRHDSTLRGVTALMRLDSQGYPGADRALANLETAFISAVTSDGSRSERDARGEWDRMVDGATTVVATVPSIVPRWEERPPAPDADALGLTGLGQPVAEPWDEPRSVPAPEPLPDFPLDALPEWSQAHAEAVAEQVQVPVDLAAMLIIGALSAAATGRARVHASGVWNEPVNLYLVTAMRSGAGKSPADKLCVEWLRRWQRERLEAARIDYDRARLKVRHEHKKLSKLEGTMADEVEVFAAQDALRAAEAAVPTLPRLLADDATPEAVATLLRDHGERLAILSTEADLFDMLLRGKPGQRASMNIYLKAWSGDSFTRDRKGGSESGPEWSELANPLMTVSVTVQPSVLGQLQTDAEMVARGFAARFMFAMPADLIGRRDQSKRFGVDRLSTMAGYEAQATALASRWATWEHPADLRVAPDAAASLLAFLDEIEPQLAPDAELEALGEWANKLHGSIVRYAGLLHLAEGNDTGVAIDEGTMRRAIALGRYWLAHAAGVQELAEDLEIRQADAILGWASGEGAEFSLSEVQRGMRRPGMGLDKINDYVPAVELLIDLGWVRPVDKGDWQVNVGVKGAPSPRFALWPRCLGKSPSVREPHRTARLSRASRFASMGERDLSSSPSSSTLPPEAREARYTRFSEAPGYPQGPDDDDPGALFDLGDDD